MARAISSRVGLGFRSSRYFDRSAMPGMQKPHWTPAAAAKALENRCRSDADSPSSVSTERPAAEAAVITHVTLACPSMSARQQPHCPCGEHPSLSDRIPQRSRSVSSSDSSARGSTRTVFPFSVNSTTITDFPTSHRFPRSQPVPASV